MTVDDLARIEPEARSLLPEFLKSGRERRVRIDALVAERNFKELHRLGHGLKGSGGIYELPAFQEVGRRMEEAAEEQNAELISTLNRQLEALLDELEAVLAQAQAGGAP